MAYELLVGPAVTNRSVKTPEMQVGEIGVIEDGICNSEVVLRIYGGLVSLDNPRHTWPEGTPMRVRVIPGAEVTIKGA